LKGLTQKIPADVQELHLYKLSIDPSDQEAKVNWRMQIVPMNLVEDVFDERFAIPSRKNLPSRMRDVPN
jgi:hypothetical protein